MASHDSDAFMESIDEEDDEASNDYSDSFESSDEDDEQEQMHNDGGNVRFGHESSKISVGVSLSLESARSASYDSKMATQPWQIGDHVQVYWHDASEWFSGKVTDVDTRTEQYFVQYEDGDEAWETGTYLRYSPAMFGFDVSQCQQLQLLPDRDDVQLVERDALVYWPESASWFAGKITATDNIRGVHIEYEDGDDRWEAKSTLRNILVLIRPPHLPPPALEKSVEVERVVVPRPYRPIIADHFQPERVARPYVCATHTIGSIVTARPNYSERKYLHVSMECTASPSTKWRTTAGEDVTSASTTTRDCLVQTAVDLPNDGRTNSSNTFLFSRCC